MLAIHSRDPLIIVPAEYTAGIISATSITAAANFIPQSLRHQVCMCCDVKQIHRVIGVVLD